MPRAGLPRSPLRSFFGDQPHTSWFPCPSGATRPPGRKRRPQCPARTRTVTPATFLQSQLRPCRRRAPQPVPSALDHTGHTRTHRRHTEALRTQHGAPCLPRLRLPEGPLGSLRGFLPVLSHIRIFKVPCVVPQVPSWSKPQSVPRTAALGALSPLPFEGLPVAPSFATAPTSGTGAAPLVCKRKWSQRTEDLLQVGPAGLKSVYSNSSCFRTVFPRGFSPA